MAEPKQKTHRASSRSRRGRKIADQKESMLIKCSKCGDKIISHRVCPTCGNYKKREIIKK